MSYFLCVLCRSTRKLTVGQISEFIEEGVYFERSPLLSAFPSVDPQSRFESMEVKYDRKRRPIILSLDDDVSEELEELTEIAQQAGSPKRVLQHIAESKQVFAIEVNQNSLTEEAWALCDCLEAHVATLLDGIVYAPGDGFFDRKLKLIHRVAQS